MARHRESRRRDSRRRGWRNIKESKFDLRPVGGFEALLVGLGFGLVGGTAIGISMRSAAVALGEPMIFIKEVPAAQYYAEGREPPDSERIRAAIDRFKEAGYNLDDLRVLYEAHREEGWHLIEEMEKLDNEPDRLFNMISQARLKRASLVRFTESEQKKSEEMKPRR